MPVLFSEHATIRRVISAKQSKREVFLDFTPKNGYVIKNKYTLFDFKPP